MRRLATALLATIVLACVTTAPATTATSRATAAATSVQQSAAATPPASAAATTSLTPSGARPAFLTYAFTNVRDGSKFTLSDFAGKSVLVIGMAVW